MKRTLTGLLGVAVWLSPQLASASEPPPERDHSLPGTKRTRYLESAPFDVVGGGSRKGDWAVELSGGTPWQRVRTQLGIGKGLTTLIEMDTVLGRRFRPAAGVGLRWIDRPHVRMSGELLLGWDWQLTPDRQRRGPNGELRMRLAFPVGRVAPYLVLATRHTLLMDRTTLETAAGPEVSWDARQAWIAWGSLGLVVAINEHVGLDFGIDFPWVDPPTPSIPGLHVGVLFGGWRAKR